MSAHTPPPDSPVPQEWPGSESPSPAGGSSGSEPSGWPSPAGGPPGWGGPPAGGPPGSEPPPGGPSERWYRSRLWRRILGVAAALAVIAAAFWLPVPLVWVEGPGPVRDVGALVEVLDTRNYTSEGKLYLTTVSLQPNVTIVEWVEAIFDPAKSVVIRDADVSFGELERQARIDMRDSQRHAKEVALTALGFPPATGKGARIVHVQPGSPAEGRLESGDIVVSVDGRRTKTMCDVGRAIDDHDVGDALRLTVKRAGRTIQVSVTTTKNPAIPGRAFVGIGMTDVGYRYEPGVDVDIRTGRIGGPSAGLMLSLAIYDRLTPDDLTGGRFIAGTGEISCDGGVLPIGGIEHKVVAAASQGVEIFLAPVTDAAAARRAARDNEDIEVVAVANFQDAVEFLQDLQ